MRLKDFDQLRSYLDRLEREPATTTGQWTIGQMLYHLAAAVELSCTPPSHRPRGVSRLLRSPMRMVVLRRGLPRGVSIPAVVRRQLDPPTDADPSAQLARLRAAIDELEHTTSELAAHPYLGPMTHDEWCRFHLRHCEHHFSHVRLLDRSPT